MTPVCHHKYSEFAEIKDLTLLDLTLRNTVIPPKGIIFQQTKNMFKFNLRSEPVELQGTINNSNEPSKHLILGIRPCDAQAFITIDRTFDAEFKDPYYLKARERTILVGLACQEPDINCFCTSMGFGPYDGSAMDIMLFELDESYLFQIYTPKGQKLIEPYSELFHSPTSEQLEKRDTICEHSRSKFIRKIETTDKPKKLAEIFESDYWATVSQKCLGCGICTYLCPTCYCFDITDEKNGTTGDRVRTWDSCMYSEYTVHASGYNPRPARMNRLRNRFYHKFKYYPDLYNMFGCTGCGRCIRNCPVNIDIIDIINGITEIQTAGDGT